MCPFSIMYPLRKGKKKPMKRIKQIDKIFENGRSKKKSCHLVPKVVTDLPFEVRKVEGSQKYRRRERFPKTGSRRAETITEPVNCCIGEFHSHCGQMMPAMWNVAGPLWRWNTGSQFIRAVIKVTAVEKSRGQGGINNQA